MAALASIMLRRASSSGQLPRALLAASSAALLAVDRSLVVPLSRFSTCSDVASRQIANEDLVHMLDMEIGRTDKILAPETRVPPEIPFRIESTESKDKVILLRRYGDEIIKAEVDTKEKERKEKKKAEVDMKEEEEKEKKWIKMVVTISKESGNNELMFRIRAFEDRIEIGTLFVKHDLWGNIEPSIYFGDLDEKVREGFHKYLEKRGINLKTTNFLREKKIAPADKKSLEYRDWLCDLEEFVAVRSAALLAVDRSLVVPLSRFSTSTDVASQPTNEDDLVRMLDGEIERVHNKNLNTCVPPGFPFRIEISESEQTITVSRRYEDEMIKGEVDVMSNRAEFEFMMDITISKESGNRELLFHTNAYNGHFSIWGLYIKKDLWGRVDDHDDNFREFGYGLRYDFEEYLEMRGFNDTTFKFLMEKLNNIRDKKWLCKLKKFVS